MLGAQGPDVRRGILHSASRGSPHDAHSRSDLELVSGGVDAIWLGVLFLPHDGFVVDCCHGGVSFHLFSLLFLLFSAMMFQTVFWRVRGQIPFSK